MSTLEPSVAETAGPIMDTATFLKFWTMGVILSSIAYGVTFTLSISTISLLHRSSKNKKERKHYILISYVVVVIILATVSIVSGISSNLNGVYTSEIPANFNLNVGRDANAVIIVLVTWASDGFLLWRATILYEEITTIRRAMMLAFFGFLMFSQIVIGILYILCNFIPALSPFKYSEPIFIAFASATLAVNWIITGLVVLRVGQYRRRVSSMLGRNYGRPFKRVMVICIESAMLIIVFATILLANNLQGESPFSLSRLLLIQIYIIAPLLILHRVTHDKEHTTEVSSKPPHHRRRSTTLRLHDVQDHPSTDISTWSKTLEVHISRDVQKSRADSDGDDIERNRPYHVPGLRDEFTIEDVSTRITNDSGGPI